MSAISDAQNKVNSIKAQLESLGFASSESEQERKAEIESQLRQAESQLSQAQQEERETNQQADDRSKAESEMFDKIKDKFAGFDSNGNPVVFDNGEYSAFDSKQFKTLANKFRGANPDSQNGSYESGFNKKQFNDIDASGNKFQGFNDQGNLIYRNEKGDLEDFGNSGGFADFARSNLQDQKFNMANQGYTNQTQNENKMFDPSAERQYNGQVINSGANAANPAPKPGTPSQPAPATTSAAGFDKFQSQLQQNAQQQNKIVQQQQAKQAVAKKQTQPPTLTGMAQKFANQKMQQAQTAAKTEAKSQATQAAQPYVNQAANAVEQATGFNPLNSIQNQAVNKVADMAGIDSGLLNQGIGAITNPQQAVQNLARQQVASNLSNLISSNTGADSGITSGLVNGLVSGDIGGAAKGMATNQAQNLATEQLTNMLGAETAAAIPGGVGGAINVLKSLTGGGNSEDKARAASQAAALSAAQAALAAPTMGLSYVVNPTTLGAAAKGLTNIKDSKTLNNMGVAGDAAKGALGVGAGALNLGKEGIGQALTGIGNQGASIAHAFKGAGAGLKNITQGNIGTGLGQLGQSLGQGLIDTFIKNPVDMAGNAIHTIGKTAGKILDALNIFCFDGETKILMDNMKYKKIKDIKVGDIVYLGGEVQAIGTAKVKGIYDYNGIKVSSDHAVFDNGVWRRVKNTALATKLHDDDCEVYPISTKNHLVVTEFGQIFADMDEVNDTYNKTDDDIIAELNNNVKRNKVLNAFKRTFIGKV